MDYMAAIESEKVRRKSEGREYAPGGVFVFPDGEYQGWMNELRDPHKWIPGCIAVDESGRMCESIGGNDQDGAETWQEIETIKRGGWRPGAGRPPLKPSLRKHKKAFSLSPESVHALKELQSLLGLPSQSVVVEFLVLKAFRESSNRVVTEHQREIF